MMSLIEYLHSRLRQLEDRKIMIPRYVKRSGEFLGKKDFSLDDIPKIDKDIRETNAAISAIKNIDKNPQNEVK